MAISDPSAASNPPSWPPFTDPPLPPPSWPPDYGGQTDFPNLPETGSNGLPDESPFGFLKDDSDLHIPWQSLQVPGMPPPPSYPEAGEPPPQLSGNSGLAADATLASKIRNEAYTRALLEHDKNLKAAVSDMVTAGVAAFRANADLMTELQAEVNALSWWNPIAIWETGQRIKNYLAEMKANNDYLDLIQKEQTQFVKDYENAYNGVAPPGQPGISNQYLGIKQNPMTPGPPSGTPGPPSGTPGPPSGTPGPPSGTPGPPSGTRKPAPPGGPEQLPPATFNPDITVVPVAASNNSR